MIETRNAFTLIELLVVVLIIAILSSVAITQYRSTTERSKMAEGVINVRAIIDAQSRFFLAARAYTPDWNELDIALPDSNTMTYNMGNDGRSDYFYISACRKNSDVECIIHFIMNAQHPKYAGKTICRSNTALGKKVCSTFGTKTEPYAYNSSYTVVYLN